jgi:predicted short-subunit dehydrogenase-like oxidoreductase (DUF2520 family)
MARNIISFAGAGRVAGALCMEFYRAGIKIQKIVSEFEDHGISLANRCKASWSSELKFPDSTDIIIVAVPDHKLKELLGNINCHEHTMVAHTAGSYGLEVFPDRLKRTGVLYPLQTFSKERKVDFNNLPFFIETSDKDFSDILSKLVESIGGNVHFVDTERRKMLHLAAVFVCNFINHMLTAGNEVASRAGFSLEVLNPLITETVSKAIDLGPASSQTGPAIRNDLNTIEKHLELLSFSPELQTLYREITRSIITHYKNELMNG